jgi:hypothetical protein
MAPYSDRKANWNAKSARESMLFSALGGETRVVVLRIRTRGSPGSRVYVKSQNIQTRHSPRATHLSIHHQIQQESCHIFYLLSLHGLPYPGELGHENEYQTSEPEYSPKLLEARSSIIRLGLLTPLLAIRSACLHLRDIPIYPDTPWFVWVLRFPFIRQGAVVSPCLLSACHVN